MLFTVYHTIDTILIRRRRRRRRRRLVQAFACNTHLFLSRYVNNSTENLNGNTPERVMYTFRSRYK